MLMEIAIFFVRLLLVGIFILAGVSKLADLAGTRQAALDFGITAALIVPFAILLPLIEIAIAVLLVIPRTVWCGAICSAVLLLGFLVVIGIHLARGRKPPCHCFGKLHSEPIGPPTVLRNLMLLCVALFLTLVGPTAVNHHLAASVDAFSFITEYAPFYILALFAFSAVQTFLVFQLIRQNGRLLLRVDTLEAERSEPVAEAGMPVGIPAPHFELLDMDGTLVVFQSSIDG